MLVQDIYVPTVLAVGKDATITEAAGLMRKHHVGSVVVCEEINGIKKPIGVITDRDIVVEIVAPGGIITGFCVEDIMTREIVTVRKDSSVYDAIKLMENEGVRRLPVVDENGGLAGMVAADDIYGYLGAAVHNLSRVSRIQRTWERELRQ